MKVALLQYPIAWADKERNLRQTEACLSALAEKADVALLPEGLLRVKTTTEPDKTAIKAALKSGQDVAGCSLVVNLSVSIK